MKKEFLMCVICGFVCFAVLEVMGYLPYIDVGYKWEIGLLLFLACLGWGMTIFSIMYKSSSLKQSLIRTAFMKGTFWLFFTISVWCRTSDFIFKLLGKEFSGASYEPLGIIYAIFIIGDFGAIIIANIITIIVARIRKQNE
jgi:hypothetical protein